MKRLAVIVLVIFCAPVLAESGLRDALRDQVFEEARTALGEANQVDAAVLTPETYRSAGAAFKRAQDAFNDGADVDRVRRLLADATRLFREAAAMAPTVQAFVEAAFEARSDALEAGAEESVEDMWRAAEEKLYEATSRAEKGRERRVERYAAEAEQLFRDAELAAIEQVLFAEIDAQIDKAKDLDADDWAPKTYEQAKSLLARAREVLAANRYDTDQPRNLARLAMHNALHAQYVSRLADDIDDNDTSLEAVLLEWQKVLQPLGEAVDVPMYYDDGPEEAIELVTAAVLDRDGRIEQLGQELASTQQRLRLVQEELLLTQSALEDRAEAQARLDRRLAEQAAREATVKRVQQLFAESEAIVLRSENKLILRMVGLGFASASAKLEPRHEPLLIKLEQALAEFPDAPVTIEGHTDAYGADATNLTLSVARAEAVAERLVEQAGIQPTRLTSLGYGETRPIANNETADGRLKNRRIDVVIYPTWWSE